MNEVEGKDGCCSLVVYKQLNNTYTLKMVCVQHAVILPLVPECAIKRWENTERMWKWITKNDLKAAENSLEKDPVYCAYLKGKWLVYNLQIFCRERTADAKGSLEKGVTRGST